MSIGFVRETLREQLSRRCQRDRVNFTELILRDFVCKP